MEQCAPGGALKADFTAARSLQRELSVLLRPFR